MREQAEVVELLDQQSRVHVISRYEAEAQAHNVVGRCVVEMLIPESREPFQLASQQLGVYANTLNANRSRV